MVHKANLLKKICFSIWVACGLLQGSPALGFFPGSESEVSAERESISGTFLSHGHRIPVSLVLPLGVKWETLAKKSRRKIPIVLFLHGAGERGDDGVLQTRVGIGEAIRLSPNLFPGIIVMPQLPITMNWSEEAVDIAKEILDKVVKTFPVDKDRIYLTGISMGGFGTWRMASKYPNSFAAIVPIASAYTPANGEVSSQLADLPVWVFHGADDPICEVECARQMVDAYRVWGKSPRYTEYPGVEHSSWRQAYQDPQLSNWLFKQRRLRESRGAAAQNQSSPKASDEIDDMFSIGFELVRRLALSGS